MEASTVPDASAIPDNENTALYGRCLALGLALLLVLRLGALYLSQADLFFDEAQYWAWSLDPAFGYFSKPPLIAWIIGATTSLCGMSEFCIRLASPFLHTLTAIFLFFVARSLYGPRIGLWSALAFATLPGVSLSASLISTDVPLLTCWAFALLAWTKLLETRAWTWAFALGLAIGIGLLAKYAMIYFVLCAALFVAIEPSARWLFRDPRGLGTVGISLGVATLLITPNILWNVTNGLVTFSHTAANAKWSGTLFHPLKALEFLGAQFGVFGPLLFAALLFVSWRMIKGDEIGRSGGATTGLAHPGRMLLSFSVPVILLITCQALLSRAHANWAAVAYPAATILVTAMLFQENRKRWFQLAFSLHLLVLFVLAISFAMAPQIARISPGTPFKRLLGWEALAGVTQAKLQERKFAAILTDDRSVTAELTYYLRDASVPILAWRPLPVPRDHFELTRPFIGGQSGDPVLFVTLRQQSNYVINKFGAADLLGKEEVSSGGDLKRHVYFYALSEYRQDGSRQTRP
ncbi:hypothetical protein MnTg02_01687 [bacterium MnTg02]|nr:hypothetical protein MnTg02_01687 [bacterium MnTg02]